jgi:DNA-binding NarL/FixJ family response regulator
MNYQSLLYVLKLMAHGKSNKEIGWALFISYGTVKSHMKEIFVTTNVINWTQAGAKATQRGLIQLSFSSLRLDTLAWN